MEEGRDSGMEGGREGREGGKVREKERRRDEKGGRERRGKWKQHSVIVIAYITIHSVIITQHNYTIYNYF